MLNDLRSDLFKIAFELEQLVGDPKQAQMTQSCRKLLIYPLTLCPLYSLTKVANPSPTCINRTELTTKPE